MRSTTKGALTRELAYLRKLVSFDPLQDRGGKFTRGFRPRFGEVKQAKEVQGAEVVDERGRDCMTMFV